MKIYIWNQRCFFISSTPSFWYPILSTGFSLQNLFISVTAVLDESKCQLRRVCTQLKKEIGVQPIRELWLTYKLWNMICTYWRSWVQWSDQTLSGWCCRLSSGLTRWREACRFHYRYRADVSQLVGWCSTAIHINTGLWPSPLFIGHSKTLPIEQINLPIVLYCSLFFSFKLTFQWGAHTWGLPKTRNPLICRDPEQSHIMRL